jgi:hypothetical protein
MKKYAVMLGLVAMVAGAFASDITVFDGRSNSVYGSWYSGSSDTRVVGGVAVREDNEVEYRTDIYGNVTAICEADQRWDLEKFTLNGSNLGMVGGYDFKDGQKSLTDPSDQHSYMGGDIFIAVDDAPVMGTSTYDPLHPTTKNNYGFDYAIQLTFNTETTGSYKVISLNSNSMVSICADIGTSNPWKYASGGGDIATKDIDFTMSSYTDAQGLHYVLDGIDLSFITGGPTIYTHYTMECGNDNLAGKATLPVPEPGSLMLFGTGLLGLIGLSIGRRKK